ncbi:MAG: cell division transport system ATP-binding protein [Limisphaerales bacterium]|jgi:cell division transport system ATP-binding protein
MTICPHFKVLHSLDVCNQVCCVLRLPNFELVAEQVIQLKNGVIYQGQAMILNEVNLEIAQGQFVYLIGKTGTGKSSLLKALYADIPLVDGEGEVAGFSLQNIKAKEVPFLRRKLGIIFQDFQLLMDRTVHENLSFVLESTGLKSKEQIKVKVNNALSKVDLQTKAHKKPFELSGGEQQRVVIARAIINNPEIILADEPTGNLDPETSDDIISLLWRISRESRTAVFMATHNYNLLEKFPSRIVKCIDGRVVEDQERIIIA